MQKRMIGVICGAAVVVLLAGSVVLLTRPSGKEDSSSDATAATTQSAEDLAALTLSDESADNVKQISVTNATGSYEVVRVKAEKTTTATDATDSTDSTSTTTETESATFRISGWEDIPTNESLLGTLANNTASLQADQCVEEHATDLDKFGLGKDATQVSMQFDDGTTFAFRIGGSVSGASCNYFALADSDTVYAVKTSLLANFSKADTDFLATTVLEKPDDDNMPTINTVTIERKDLDTPIVLEHRDTSNDGESGNTQSTHKMTSPISAYLSVERSKDVIEGLFGLSASKILAVRPSEQDLEDYGISDPFATLTLECEGGTTYTLKIGDVVTEADDISTDDSTATTSTATTYYPVQLDDGNVIYAIAADKCPWATITPTGLASKLIFTTYVWDISELDVTVDGKKTTFENSGTDKDTASITRDGKSEIDTERYRQFYAFLLQTAAEEVVLGDAPTGTPDAEIHYKTSDGSEDRTVAFYQIDDFNCYITVNGELSFQCRASYLDALRHNLDIFDTDEDFQTSWQ